MAGKIMSGWSPTQSGIPSAVTDNPSAIFGNSSPGPNKPLFGSPTPSNNQSSSISPTSIFGNPATFTAAANTQAGDYDKIMQSYRDFITEANKNPINTQKINPTITPYSQSADVTKSLSNLSELSKTGGYSDQGIADLRARGISPIRSVYANAQRNIDRQKAIQGGYSPNYTAATAKLTRGLSDAVSEGTQNVNAGIAQNVASNRLSAAPNYASAAGSANTLKTSIDKANADIINQINESNANRDLQAKFGNKSNILGGIQGQTSLYGTTPALTSLFGNQVIQAGQMGQNQQRLNLDKNNSNLSMLSRFGGQ